MGAVSEIIGFLFLVQPFFHGSFISFLNSSGVRCHVFLDGGPALFELIIGEFFGTRAELQSATDGHNVILNHKLIIPESKTLWVGVGCDSHSNHRNDLR